MCRKKAQEHKNIVIRNKYTTVNGIGTLLVRQHTYNTCGKSQMSLTKYNQSVIIETVENYT